MHGGRRGAMPNGVRFGNAAALYEHHVIVQPVAVTSTDTGLTVTCASMMHYDHTYVAILQRSGGGFLRPRFGGTL